MCDGLRKHGESFGHGAGKTRGCAGEKGPGWVRREVRGAGGKCEGFWGKKVRGEGEKKK